MKNTIETVPTPPRPLHAKEAYQWLGISRNEFDKLVKRGEIRMRKLSQRNRLFLISDLQAFLDSK